MVSVVVVAGNVAVGVFGGVAVIAGGGVVVAVVMVVAMPAHKFGSLSVFYVCCFSIRLLSFLVWYFSVCFAVSLCLCGCACLFPCLCIVLCLFHLPCL